MKKLAAIVAVAVFVCFSVGSFSYAAEPSSKPMAAAEGQTVKGEITKIEGENYVVKDASGKEARLHVDKTTQKEGALKVGDKVEASVTKEGHAISIKAAK